jgi:hypothetical protein
MDRFDTFNITSIPREKNILADSLATAASRLSPLEDYEASLFTVELLYKPSVPNNISNWKHSSSLSIIPENSMHIVVEV